MFAFRFPKRNDIRAISAEHGIGSANHGRLARVADPLDIDLMRGIKQLLDPNGLMNPGKIFAAGNPGAHEDDECPPSR
ncbi:FAD-binding oxidoreductase [Bradyrhizobium sp. BWA-3-5]|uniref:FAD-binding oxidoreductase n=1 Tax=Bradyrhizobium sp. BWA-3-5 TaxID=3080013 RepID=UPI00293E6B3F|nr:FAD-linked oxidase C-terminal domain-containing protein [Bradyrhizobium sp. BWA-3-5]WOH69355.1 FAD-linked oxidase C-terminal domain-containing protein [Bradyrhizobium sp. BWA-3-5]